MIMKSRKRVELGQYVVADPEICHGKLTIRGTRILVADILHLIGRGYDWEHISAEYGGKLSHEAIAEVVQIAREALLEKSEKRRKAA
jgi:uncharacterized protein (DUF433 family)